MFRVAKSAWDNVQARRQNWQREDTGEEEEGSDDGDDDDDDDEEEEEDGILLFDDDIVCTIRCRFRAAKSWSSLSPTILHILASNPP